MDRSRRYVERSNRKKYGGSVHLVPVRRSHRIRTRRSGVWRAPRAPTPTQWRVQRGTARRGAYLVAGCGVGLSCRPGRGCSPTSARRGPPRPPPCARSRAPAPIDTALTARRTARSTSVGLPRPRARTAATTTLYPPRPDCCFDDTLTYL